MAFFSPIPTSKMKLNVSAQSKTPPLNAAISPVPQPIKLKGPPFAEHQVQFGRTASHSALSAVSSPMGPLAGQGSAGRAAQPLSSVHVSAPQGNTEQKMLLFLLPSPLQLNKGRKFFPPQSRDAGRGLLRRAGAESGCRRLRTWEVCI